MLEGGNYYRLTGSTNIKSIKRYNVSNLGV